MVDTSPRCTIVCPIYDPHVRDTPALDGLHAYAIESDVVYAVFVATVDGKYPVAVVAQDVAVGDADMMNLFALFASVVAVSSYVDGMREVAP